MTILIDDALVTSFFTIPVREGWVDDVPGVRLAERLSADEVTVDDVALVPAAVATMLVQTHVIDRSVAIIHDGIGMTGMWTSVRPDELEDETVYLHGVGVAGETLARALVQPYFGVTPKGFEASDAPPGTAKVVITEGVPATGEPAEGFREDLARTWFIMTGFPFVSHVAVVGVRALARDADDQLGVLSKIVATGHERRRDLRRIIHESTGADRDLLAEVTGRMRYRMEPDDAEPARRLVAAATRGTAFGRTLPAFRDQLPGAATDHGDDLPTE